MPKIRSEDHNLLVTIEYNNTRVEEVPCKIFLPVVITDPVIVHLYPSQEQAKKILKETAIFSIYGTEFGPRDTPFAEINAKDLLLVDIQHDYKASKRIDYLLVADPMELTIVDNLPTVSSKISTTRGSFILTKNRHLYPWKSPRFSETGDEHTEILRQISVTLPNDVTAFFDVHERKRENEDEETVLFTELVANFEFNGGTGYTVRVNETLRYLDDYLLLASFAERKRCLCLRWEAQGEKTLTKYYRKRYMPSPRKRSERDESLIDTFLFEEYMKVAYGNFVKAPHQNLLRRAINYTLPPPEENRIIESSFVTLYAALETLILYFRRNQGIEMVLPHEKWSELDKDLRDYLKNNDLLKGNGQVRGLLYEKLPELNRVSFSSAFKKFCTHYGLDLHDLWDVVGRAKGVTLSDIRNRLVHGDDFEHSQYSALISATDHLKWTVERMVLAVLGWDVARSEVSANNLAREIAGRSDWKLERQSLTDSLAK